MPGKANKTVEQKLDQTIELLRHLLAIELARSGVKTTAIAKHLHVATATAVKLLKGVERNA